MRLRRENRILGSEYMSCNKDGPDRTVVYLSLAKIFGTIKPSFPTPRFTNYNFY